MDERTHAINSSLMIGGAVVLLGVLAWVSYAVSEPLIPNTGSTASTTEKILE